MASNYGVPAFVTFTGGDEWTDVDGMKELAARYPIEWGILMSPTRQGVEARYPKIETLVRICGTPGLKLSAHLCGGHSRAIMESAQAFTPIALGRFQRVQINHRRPELDKIETFQKRYLAKFRCIVQTRDESRFPGDSRVDFLYDPSGGRGLAPVVWPKHESGRLAGFAGGITPDNVEQVLAKIDAGGPYWIDMESGVRTNDRLDLEKCRQVCQNVYGIRR